MADTQDKPKPNYRSKEWMVEIRKKAHATKAEQKKAKEAEKFIKNTKAKHTIQEAEKLVLDDTSNKPTVVGDEPKPSQHSKQETTDFKQEYYKTKLEMLKTPFHTEGTFSKYQKEVAEQSHAYEQPHTQPHTQPHLQPHIQPLPHKLLKHEFQNDINKTVMKQLWQRYFNTATTPYD